MRRLGLALLVLAVVAAPVWAARGTPIIQGIDCTATVSHVVGSQSGLGYRIWFGWQTFQVETMYQSLIAVSVLGLALFEAVQQLDGRLLRWRGRR